MGFGRTIINSFDPLWSHLKFNFYKMKNLLFEQIKSLTKKDLPLVSNLSNASAILNTLENINWCGFYIVKDNTLYLGPFQGEVACTTIPYGKGVCGTCLKMKQSTIVNDVTKFEGHIACSSLSKSETVVPIIKDNIVMAVIDIDSPLINRFTKENQLALEEIAEYLSTLF